MVVVSGGGGGDVAQRAVPAKAVQQPAAAVALRRGPSGVSWNSTYGKWQAHIRFDVSGVAKRAAASGALAVPGGRRFSIVHLGFHESAEAAARAYEREKP